MADVSPACLLIENASGRFRRTPPVVAGLLALTVACWLAYFANQRYVIEREDRLSATSERIERRVFRNMQVLQSIRGLFLAQSGLIARPQLQRFLSSLPLDADLKGAQGYGFALGLPAGEAATARGIVARDYGVDRAPWPQSNEPVIYPVVLLEPQDRSNVQALNYDMYSDPVRRAAMRKAAESGQPTMTAPVKLVQDGEQTHLSGFLVYLPIYGVPNAPSARPVAGQNGGGALQPLGFVYAPFRVGDLVAAVMKDDKDVKTVLRIYYEKIADDHLIYANVDRLVDPAVARVRVGDADWIFQIGEVGDRGVWDSPALLVLALGFAFALAISGAAYQQMRHIDAAEHLAAEIARSAEQKEILLLEMRHRIKNSIARILALFRLSAREARDRDSFASAFEQRLQAMANAQSLLVSGVGGAMSLRDLLTQAAPDFSKSSGAVAIKGPNLHLDEEQAQALGLIIHEWSTNSLKYGALACGGRLNVDWRVDHAPGGDVVLLNWIETGLKQTPDLSRAGFGSRLTQVMVQGSLNGELKREAGEGALTMRLTFPLVRPLPTPA